MSKTQHTMIKEDREAAQMADDAGQAPGAKKPKKVLSEEIKDRHTSHWDMDMMSRAELEALMKGRE